ncbi:MAG: hypothetical protein O4803_07350 [Trichodesmium sp. St15_bin1_1]|nr:hypothetical protein [Trichodesmium sp. St15_bin1_1]
MGHLLRKRLGRWASRRHPNKPITWVKQKYFRTSKDPETGYLMMANIY